MVSNFIERPHPVFHIIIGWYQGTIGNGTRSSSASAFLSPQFTGRSNLHLLLNTKVLRILSTSQKGSAPSFNSIQIDGEYTYFFLYRSLLVLTMISEHGRVSNQIECHKRDHIVGWANQYPATLDQFGSRGYPSASAAWNINRSESSERREEPYRSTSRRNEFFSKLYQPPGRVRKPGHFRTRCMLTNL